jgi:hypothetical protein
MQLWTGRQNSETFLSVNMKTIKILPLEDVDTRSVDSSSPMESTNLTQWMLTYIEFIGNVVILVFMVAFSTIY